MTKEARLTQKYLRGEILKLLDGERAALKTSRFKCAFCLQYDRTPDCEKCPLEKCYPGAACTHDDFQNIHIDMLHGNEDAIPGALAIYMWLYDL